VKDVNKSREFFAGGAVAVSRTWMAIAGMCCTWT
jgi:hypothetical protein